jgi:hypothetical protein
MSATAAQPWVSLAARSQWMHIRVILSKPRRLTRVAPTSDLQVHNQPKLLIILSSAHYGQSVLK